jgi:uncharacterized protein YndB with AHSA1/START domain
MSGMPAARSATAATTIAAPPDRVFALLADLRNHWRLAGPWIEVVALHPADGPAHGATVRLRGPLGLARSMSTVVDEASADTRLRGHAIAGATRADVAWGLEPHEQTGGTRVTITVALRTAAWHDRLLWALGGRRWLARRLRHTAVGLDELLPRMAEVAA